MSYKFGTSLWTAIGYGVYRVTSASCPASMSSPWLETISHLCQLLWHPHPVVRGETADLLIWGADRVPPSRGESNRHREGSRPAAARADHAQSPPHLPWALERSELFVSNLITQKSPGAAALPPGALSPV